MAELVLKEIRPDGEVEVGRLIAGPVVIGREPGEGIAIDHSAISRSHGVFNEFGDHWVYQDLNSTNGSWLNGTQFPSGARRVIRGGDLLQLADVGVRILDSAASRSPTMVGLSSIGGRSILAFRGDDFAGEFPVSEYGRALSLGGSKADLPLDGDLAELPSLVIERRGDRICAFSLNRDVRFTVNGKECEATEFVVDGDELRIGNYLFLINDPTGRTPTRGAVTGQTATSELSDSLAGREWDRRGFFDTVSSSTEAKGSGFLGPFGRADTMENEVDETVAIDPGQFSSYQSSSRYDRHPSRRYEMDDVGTPAVSAIEDRIVILIGFILIIILIGLFVVWFVFM